ncbi:lipocalin family protein [Mucilaginibacter sp. SP1R1]|uniref:lipocalin family protein n=1 Tax=Mucilaginibacter sp. SP1R1 TaxID=2723091 RepID=UPI00161D1CEF|nr:lipocalin family protein [Mucilaginibacter sp. SP1R1]MBB6147602.1 hypothetical protein [Mucilaginibacter sp. SP1R1]
MKYLIPALLVAIIIQTSACKKSNTSVVNTSLTGQWKLSRSLISSGGPQYWVKATNTSYVLFNDDGALGGTAFTDYKLYTIKDSVTLTFTTADKAKYQNFRYKIKGDSLTMSPNGPIFCIEGCAIQFVKVP